MNDDNEYCKPCSNYNTCFLVSCINHRPANPFSYDNPCPIRRVVYKCGIWNGALDYMTNFAKEQREKYVKEVQADSIKNTKMEEYLKESLDNFNFTDYFNALCDSLEERYRKEEIKMDYGNPNDLFDAISYSVDAVNKTLADSTKGCCCNAEKEETKMDYEKPNYLSDSDACRGSINKVADKLDGVRTEDRIYQTAKTPIYPEHDICNEPIKDNNIVCSDSHTTDFEPTVTSNPCVSVLSKALVQLDKGEITLSEIANLAWILSDIYSDED